MQVNLDSQNLFELYSNALDESLEREKRMSNSQTQSSMEQNSQKQNENPIELNISKEAKEKAEQSEEKNQINPSQQSQEASEEETAVDKLKKLIKELKKQLAKIIEQVTSLMGEMAGLDEAAQQSTMQQVAILNTQALNLQNLIQELEKVLMANLSLQPPSTK